MITLEEWLEGWRSLTDPKEKADYIATIPAHLESEKEVIAAKSWWGIRYFYADKAKTRLGDKFIWLFLALGGPYNNKTGQKELLKIYKETFESPEAKKALELGEQELRNQLIDAAKLYVSTIGDPPALMGIVTRKDKSPKDRIERIAKMLVDEHFQALWVVGKNLPYMPLLGETLYQAAVADDDKITFEFSRAIELVKDPELKDWIKKLADLN